MGMLPCPFPFPIPIPCRTLKEQKEKHEEQEFDQSIHSTSLLSQPSLPSVPSLTPPPLPPQPSHHNHEPTNADYHHSLAAVATLKGHSSYVFFVVLGGKYLYSGSSDGQIRRWSLHPSTSINNQNGCVVAEVHSGVKSMVVLGDKLFTAHHDHKIRVWKIEEKNRDDYSGANYRCIATLPTLNERCSKLFSPKNYVEIRRHKKSTWVHHVDAVSALALSKDKELLYSVSWDRTFKVWRTSDFKCLESVQNAHDDAINAIVVSDDGFVYTGSADKKMKVWKKKFLDQEKIGEQRKNKKKKFKHSLVATLEKHKSAVNALALSKDGSVLYSGACDRSIIVWEKEDGGCGGGDGVMVVSGALRGHGKAILCLVVVEDLVVSGSADKTVRVWRRESIGRNYCCLAVFEGHKSPVKCLTAAAAAMDDSDGFSENSYVVCSGGLDFDVKVWKICVPSHVHT